MDYYSAHDRFVPKYHELRNLFYERYAPSNERNIIAKMKKIFKQISDDMYNHHVWRTGIQQKGWFSKIDPKKNLISGRFFDENGKSTESEVFLSEELRVERPVDVIGFTAGTLNRQFDRMYFGPSDRFSSLVYYYNTVFVRVTSMFC